MKFEIGLILCCGFFSGCTHFEKKSIIPLPVGTEFTVRQGAFGKSSHNQTGNEYAWDLEVPFGQEVISAFDGRVYFVYQPQETDHGCFQENRETAWNILIENTDSSVSQYTHVDSNRKVGEKIRKGDVIGHTIQRGWICYPHLHYSVFENIKHLYNSGQAKTLSIQFLGIPGGRLQEGQKYKTGDMYSK